MAEEEEVEYGLVMPFVVVQSKGGAYEDNSYSAGWETGIIWASLEHGKPEFWEGVVRTENVPQVDLVAMKFGYSITHRQTHVGGWTTIRIEKKTVVIKGE